MPFTPEQKAEILEKVATGLSEGVPLRELCRGEGMPSFVAVYDWINADPDWGLRIARAREFGADALAEECLSIADNASNDWMDNHNPDDPGYRLNGEHVQRSKLRIETRLKLLAKWSSKKYGEHVQLEHSGEIKTPAETDLSKLSIEDLVTLRAIQAKAAPDAPSVD